MTLLVGEALCAKACGAPVWHGSQTRWPSRPALAEGDDDVRILIVILRLALDRRYCTYDRRRVIAGAPRRHTKVVDCQPVVISGIVWVHPPQPNLRPLVAVTASAAATAVRFAAALPSRAAAVAPVTGPVKLNAEKVVQPLDGAFAPVMTPALAYLGPKCERVRGHVPAIAPLLAHIADVERGNRSAGIVRQPGCMVSNTGRPVRRAPELSARLAVGVGPRHAEAI